MLEFITHSSTVAKSLGPKRFVFASMILYILYDKVRRRLQFGLRYVGQEDGAAYLCRQDRAKVHPGLQGWSRWQSTESSNARR